MTFAEMLRDYWAHLHVDDPKLREQLGDDDFDATLREMGMSPEEVAAAPDTTAPDDTELVVEETYGAPR